MRTLIIAEAGVNHNGDVERALELVSAAKSAGADIVKFQHFRAESIVSRSAPTAEYQKQNTGAKSQFELLKALEIDLKGFRRISAHCQCEGIEFLCTAFDLDAAAELVGLGMKRMKIPSGELTNGVMLRAYVQFGLPVILSTGMATLEEVGAALGLLKESGASDVTLLHCTSLYPAPVNTLNLRAIGALRDEFKVPIGYSDHSLGDTASIAAVSLGATVIEKHFTLDRRLPGPDHLASLEPDAFAVLVSRIREVEAMLGDGVKRPSPAELDTAALVRRSWHASRDLPKGTVLAEADVVLMRPAAGVCAMRTVSGFRLTKPVAAGAPITTDVLAQN